MSSFDLVPVDGGDPIHVPPGETVLGRGPFLGVSDKRVSRNHGLLENLDGQLRLKPTHLNPCFIQSSLTDDPKPLTKGSWYLLHHGDFFSLLPGQFIYKVVDVDVDVGEEDHTPKNSQMFAEEDPPVSPRPAVEPPPPPSPPPSPPSHIGGDQEQPPPQEEPAAAGCSNPGDAESPASSSVKVDLAPPTQVKNNLSRAAPPVQRKRVLPAWMMSSAASSSSSSKVQSPVKKYKAPAPSSKPAAAKRSTPAHSSSPEEAELSVEKQPKKRRRKMKSDEEEEAQTVVPVVQLRTDPKRSEVSDESDSFTMEVDEEQGGGETSTAHRDTSNAVVGQPEEDKKLKNGGRANGGSSQSKPRLRTPCPYGKDCYRKNPLHFQECSHPGDTDYEEEEEEKEEEDLPECPYGTDCYRKNPLHRKEYKHTKKPAPTTRTRPKKPANRDDDDDEEDEDEYENSFIDDDSLEEDDSGGDDSDYVPPASDESDKEDVRTLQREAQDFVKKGK